jgi:hypothetical protein
MPSFSVLVHVQPGDNHLGRLLETLRPADETVLVDHSGEDSVRKVAREYGARVVEPVPGVDRGAYAVNCANDWVLCLLPAESLSEALEAALFDWKRNEPDNNSSFSVPIREQDRGAWKVHPEETRLVNRSTVNWQGVLPPPMPTSQALAGHVLRFTGTD